MVVYNTTYAWLDPKPQTACSRSDSACLLDQIFLPPPLDHLSKLLFLSAIAVRLHHHRHSYSLVLARPLFSLTRAAWVNSVLFLFFSFYPDLTFLIRLCIWSTSRTTNWKSGKEKDD
ncbi:hypothetical protein BCV70DRAFT_73741 [Testicularia cyperi]|uniref:Uncharacterized protein n=1 Tax=Testicularia cyperi TaxID=1882483 RepID=A0A317XTL3_9BASI|nr:hypothetical protein BCV70DRAFT_73741 [Testicularia cyperi]